MARNPGRTCNPGKTCGKQSRQILRQAILAEPPARNSDKPAGCNPGRIICSMESGQAKSSAGTPGKSATSNPGKIEARNPRRICGKQSPARNPGKICGKQCKRNLWQATQPKSKRLNQKLRQAMQAKSTASNPRKFSGQNLQRAQCRQHLQQTIQICGNGKSMQHLPDKAKGQEGAGQVPKREDLLVLRPGGSVVMFWCLYF